MKTERLTDELPAARPFAQRRRQVGILRQNLFAVPLSQIEMQCPADGMVTLSATGVHRERTRGPYRDRGYPRLEIALPGVPVKDLLLGLGQRVNPTERFVARCRSATGRC